MVKNKNNIIHLVQNLEYMLSIVINHVKWYKDIRLTRGLLHCIKTIGYLLDLVMGGGSISFLRCLYFRLPLCPC